MTRRHAATVGWIWAITVATLSELPFVAFLGLTGLAQAAVILFLTWLLLKRMRGTAILGIVVLLACLNGPPAALAPTMFLHAPDSSGVIDMTKPAITSSSVLAALPILAVRSLMMLIALLPLGFLHARSVRPK